MSAPDSGVDEEALEIIEIRLQIDVDALHRYLIENVSGFPAAGELQVKQFNKGQSIESRQLWLCLSFYFPVCLCLCLCLCLCVFMSVCDCLCLCLFLPTPHPLRPPRLL